MNIRLADESDLPQLMALSEAAGEAAHWTRQQWLDIFHSQTPARLAWIAETGAADGDAVVGDNEGQIQNQGQEQSQRPHICQRRADMGHPCCFGSNPFGAAGFLVAQNGGPEWELENIAVRPEFRRQGVACALLSALLAQARSLQAERILLEVRASNHAAIRLYQASGFQGLARRRDYYRNPAEDAVILVHLFRG